MKKHTRLIDSCEYNTVCFSDMLSELRRIVVNQAIIAELLFKILDNLDKDNCSDTINKIQDIRREK